MVRLVFVLGLSLLAAPAAAQILPRSITIVVPFAPGASADAMGRLLATELGPRTGAAVVVDNKPGAGGSIGVSFVTKAAPDGATFGLSAPGAIVVNPHVPNATAPDPLPALTPVARVAAAALVLVVNAQSGIKTVEDLVEKSKANPNGLSYGTPGAYSQQRFAVEALSNVTGANLVHIAYRGSAPAVTDLLAGNISLASVDLTSALPHIKAGTLVALGLATSRRSQIAPEIPLLSDVFPRFRGLSTWFGFFAPRGTPSPLVAKMSSDLQTILAVPNVRDKLLAVALEPDYQDAEGFAKFVAGEAERWKIAIKQMPATP